MIKVVTERQCHPGKEEELKRALGELRNWAMKKPGYYHGETLRSTDDTGAWLVINSWTFVDEWKAWRDSTERQEITARIQSLLVGPPKETVFQFVSV
jgi:antibiotic biosynthesis monooxygenase (ABM) superfamily enzyme